MKAYDQIREVMRGAGPLSEEQVLARAGVDAARVAAFLRRDEVKRVGEDPASYTYTLVPPAAAAAPAKKAKKKRAKKRRAPAERKKLRAIAAKARAARSSVPTAHELAVESYRHVGRSLRDYLRTAVDGVDGDQILCMLIDSHERAEKLVDATMGRT